ncbi:hypothetical protein ABZ397_30645 [Streptomyces sp. NPDC005876]|uniref:hypothetical protein n=1 Tax=Streptomyces sp. NPDC005876 TaxID=3157076 RepID=UPI0033DD2457
MYSILIRLRSTAEPTGAAVPTGADALARRFATDPLPGVEHVYLQPVHGGFDGIVFVVAEGLQSAVQQTCSVVKSVISVAEPPGEWWLETCQADLLNVSAAWLPDTSARRTD